MVAPGLRSGSWSGAFRRIERMERTNGNGWRSCTGASEPGMRLDESMLCIIRRCAFISIRYIYIYIWVGRVEGINWVKSVSLPR